MTSAGRPTGPSRDPTWPGASADLPSVATIEALGLAVSLYLPTLMDERPDPRAPHGPPLVDARFDVPDHLVEADGRLGTGLLAALVDNVGGMATGLAVLPDWIVTTNLTLRRPVPPLDLDGGSGGEGPLSIEAGVLRRGRSTVVSEVAITGPDGSTVATALMTSSILTPEQGPPPVPRPLRRRPVPIIDDPLYRSAPEVFFALEPGRRPGEMETDAPPRLRNPWGIVHGGALAVIVDAAARAAVAHPTGIDTDPGALRVTDVVLHYLSPGRVGPVVARAELVGQRGDDHLVRVIVRDRGADDRVLVLSALTVRTRR